MARAVVRSAIAAVIFFVVFCCASGCSSGAQTPTTTPEPAPTEQRSCWSPEERHRRLYADLDGDGLDEVLFVNETPTGTEVEVCESTTVTVSNYAAGGNKPASIYVVDVESDGTDELLIGAPTGAAAFVGGIVRVVDGQWLSDTQTVTVLPTLDNPGVRGESFVCLAEQDGSPTLLALSYVVDGDVFRWEAGQQSGEFALPEESVQAWIWASGFCGNDIPLPLAPSPVATLLRVVGTSEAPEELPAPADGIGLGLHDEVIVERGSQALTSRDGWVLDVAAYAQFDGPFSALDVLNRADRVQVVAGSHDHCAGPPLQGPTFEEPVTILAIQPTGPSSCIDWFSVNLFVTGDFAVRAITLELFGA